MSNNQNLPNTNTKLSDIPDSKPTYVPKSTYWHRIKDAEFGMSKSSQSPMFTLTVEICDHPGYPDPKNPGSIVDVNGTEATMWVTLTDKASFHVKKFFKACGLPLDLSIADLVANPNPAFLLGKKFLALGYSKADIQVDEITKQPIKNPLTGQDLVYYQYKVGEIFPQS